MKLALIALAMMGVLTGCATTPVPFDNSKMVDESKVFYRGHGDAILKIKRDRGMYGGGCPYIVYVNGKKSAELRQGEAVVLYADIGEAIIGVGPDDFWCGGPLKEIGLILKPGDANRLRIQVDSGGYSISPTATN